MKYISGDSIYSQANKCELLKSHDTSFRGLPDALIFGVRLCYNAPKHRLAQQKYNVSFLSTSKEAQEVFQLEGITQKKFMQPVCPL